MAVTGGRLHHAALCVADMEARLRLYRDGLGLVELMDEEFEGDWPDLFDAPSRVLRSRFLGDPAAPAAGVVELVAFQGGLPDGAAPAPPANGFFLLSFYVDLEATLERLGRLERPVGPVRRIEQAGLRGPVQMATLRDPDGVLVELIDVGPASGS